MNSVLGKGLKFEDIRAETYTRTKIKITPNRLYQRSDKAQRYSEFNSYLGCVETAYKLITQPPKEPSNGQPRTFTDEQVKQASIVQRGKCYYCGCPLSEGMVGDHKVPYSRGGLSVLSNLAAACVRCNTEKGSMSEFEYGKLVGKRNSRGREL